MCEVQSERTVDIPTLFIQTRELLKSTKLLRVETRSMRISLDEITIPADLWDIMLFLYKVVHPALGTVFSGDQLRRNPSRSDQYSWFMFQGFATFTRPSEDMKNCKDKLFWKKLGIEKHVRRTLPFDSYFASQILQKLSLKNRLAWFCRFHCKVQRLTFKSKLFTQKTNMQVVSETMIKYQTVQQCTFNFYVKKLLVILAMFHKNLALIVIDYFWC